MKEPRRETLAIGAVFFAILAPFMALYAWAVIAAVSRWGSDRASALVIGLGELTLIAVAAIAESVLLRMSIGRCLVEAAAAGWAFVTPNLLVYGWALPQDAVRPYAIACGIVLALWIIVFVFVFRSNSLRRRQSLWRD